MAITPTYTFDTDHYIVTGGTGEGDLIIPDFYNDGVNGEYPVTTIAYAAFHLNKNINNVYFGNEITTIGASAFSYCTSISGLFFDINKSKLTTIANSAFVYCETIDNVIFPDSYNPIEYPMSYEGSSGATERYSGIFYNTDILNFSIYVDGDFERSKSKFLGCLWYATRSTIGIYDWDPNPIVVENLKIRCNGKLPDRYCYRSFNTPKKVTILNATIIGEDAFDANTGLSEIIFPNELEEIQEGAFQSCKNLLKSTIVFPNSLKKLNRNCLRFSYSYSSDSPKLIFGDCRELVLDQYVFNDDWVYETSLPSPTLYFLSETPPTINANTFYGCRDQISCYVNNHNKANYISAFSSATKVSVYGKDWYDFGVSNTSYIDLNGWGDITPSSTLTIPSSFENLLLIKNLGTNAFVNDSTIETLNTGDTLEIISDGAFANSSLQTLNIGSSVSDIASTAFNGCSDLTSISANNSTYYSITNALLRKDTNDLVLGCKTSIVPTNVTRIRQNAFNGMGLNGTLIFPYNVKQCDTDAFANNSLSQVDYRGSLKDWCLLKFANESANPASGATLYCNNVAVASPLTISELKYVNDYTLSGITDVWYRYGIQHVGLENGTNVTFSGSEDEFATICTDSTTVENATYLEVSTPVYTSDFVFETEADGTDKLVGYFGNETAIVVPSNNPSTGNIVSHIAFSAFQDNTTIQSIWIPDSVDWIDGCAFMGCSALSSVTLPDSLEYLGDFAFKGCSSLASLEISPNEDYGSYYYSSGNCIIERLTGKIVAAAQVSVTIPSDSILTRSAFDGTALTSITIPSGCEIESHAFINSALTSISIPADCVVGSSAFSECASLVTATLAGTSVPIGAFESCSALTTVVSTTITNVADTAFYNCPLLSTWVGFGSITTVGNHAFEKCAAFNPSLANLTSVGGSAFKESGVSGAITILATLTSIGESAFALCSGITSVTSNAGVIPKFLFAGCSGLLSVDFSKVVSYGFGCLLECTAITSLTVSNAIGHISTLFGALDRLDYDTPSGLNALTVAYVAGSTQSGGAFSNFKNLESVTIGEGITRVEDEWFSDCYNLDTVSFPSTLLTIGKSAFFADNALTSVTIPVATTTIEANAFFRCGLTSITLNTGVTTIGGWAFAMNPFTSATVDLENVQTLGEHAFFKCVGLTTIDGGDALISIGEFAFDGCTSLTEIDLTGATDLETIGRGAFHNTQLVSGTATTFALIDKFKIVKKVGSAYLPIKGEGNGYVLGSSYEIDDTYPLKLCKTGLHYSTNLFELFDQYGGTFATDCEILSVTLPANTSTLVEIGSIYNPEDPSQESEQESFGICCSNKITIDANLPSWKASLKSIVNNP